MILNLLFLAATLSFDSGQPDLAFITGEARGRVGVAAVLDGRMVELRAGEAFPMQSVYKFPIAMAVLHEADTGALRLDQAVTVRKSELVPASLHSPIRDQNPQGDFALPLRDLLRYAVSESDGTASDVLLRVVGGPAKVQKYLGSLGIKEIRVVNTEAEMARDDQAQYGN